EDGKPRPRDGRVARHGDEERREPARMQQHEQRIMPATLLHGTATQQRLCIAPGVDELGEPQQYHQRQDETRCAHAASSSWNPAVNPGPSDVTIILPRLPDRSTRSSTKSTVAADMLP